MSFRKSKLLLTEMRWRTTALSGVRSASLTLWTATDLSSSRNATIYFTFAVSSFGPALKLLVRNACSTFLGTISTANLHPRHTRPECLLNIPSHWLTLKLHHSQTSSSLLLALWQTTSRCLLRISWLTVNWLLILLLISAKMPLSYKSPS